MKFVIVLAILLIAIGTVAYLYNLPTEPTVEWSVKAFSSEQEFLAYLEESSALAGYGIFGVGAQITPAMVEEMREGVPELGKDVVEPTRVSETTVQVSGIDEPDIVKTDGRQIYFSPQSYRYWWGMESIPYYQYETKVLKAFPPEDLDVMVKIDKNGDLLLHNNILIIFSGDKIYGYDVSDPENPEESWNVEMNSTLVGARLYQDKIYLITKKNINHYHPCPVVPLTRNGVPLVIECVRIYHPISPVQIDVTYNTMVLNPTDGEVEKSVSFVGSSWSSIVYMSTNAIYVTYLYQGDIIEIFSNFLKEDASDLIPSYVIAKLDQLKDYNISMTSKMTEMGIILQEYMSSLSRDEQLRIQNELSNRMVNYTAEHKREFIKTGIAKIGLDMEVLGSGSVPGQPLNQFSLDEYEDHLRIAVTVGGGWWGWGGESANDVYVLDKDLNIVGSVIDLGLTERIYSVRFIQDKGYVVTFRQIDPFYVLDLSSPTNPELKGELKIPGYSSYLHPITADKILGIGKEGSYVKVSLFDVSSPENPVERDKYSLTEYWSDILDTYHAFLLDDKHKIFFLPGSNGGYVFSYENDKLSMVKAVSEIRARRAVYIDDYLYIIGDNKVVVLDENTWDKVNELEFSGSPPEGPVLE